jgi:hypothetical protein
VPDKPKPSDLDLAGADWKGKDEVQIAFIDEWIVMRNGSDPQSPVLVFDHNEWRAFVLGARDGEFDIEAEPTNMIELGHKVAEIERTQGIEAAEKYVRDHASKYPFYEDLKKALAKEGKLPPGETIL